MAHYTKLTPVDIERIGVDELSRRIFAYIKHVAIGPGGDLRCFHYTEILSGTLHAPVGKAEEKRFDGAWFRLVDRNLIRWSEGPTCRAYHELTERGANSSYHEGVIDEPEPTIAELERGIGCPLDPTAKQYLSEAIATYRDRHLLASQFCVGAVSERIVFMLRDWILGKVGSDSKLAKLSKVGAIIDGLTTGFEELKNSRSDLHQIADLLGCIEHFSHAYRQSRNDVGHPSEVRNVNEDELAVMLTAMHRRYIPAAYHVLVLQL